VTPISITSPDIESIDGAWSELGLMQMDDLNAIWEDD